MSQEGGASEQPPHHEGGEGDQSPPGEATPGDDQKEEGSNKVDEERVLLPPSQTMAEPPGEGTQLPSATQESLAEHYFRVLKQDREITRPVRVLLWQKSQRM